MKRDLEQMETMHNLYCSWYKGMMLTNSLLMVLLVMIIPFCAKVAVDNLREGDILWVVIEIVLVWINIFNLLRTVKLMIREYKDFKEENKSYELIREELLKLREMEEAIGEGIELVFGEDDE